MRPQIIHWLIYCSILNVTTCFKHIIKNSIFPRSYSPSISRLSMAFDTIVKVKSNYEAKCSIESDPNISLSTYMQLPVDQYVCIKMPLDATLNRMDDVNFNLTVPPVRFFHLDVSPTIICQVTQTPNTVRIQSNNCVLRGSPFVEKLNGCYKIDIDTTFRWIDTNIKRSILSSSNIYVEVDPPAPFKYFGKTVLETTGTLAMSIALRQIENAFVQSLAADYDRWAVNSAYRRQRERGFCSVFDEDNNNNVNDNKDDDYSSRKNNKIQDKKYSTSTSTYVSANTTSTPITSSTSSSDTNNIIASKNKKDNNNYSSNNNNNNNNNHNNVLNNDAPSEISDDICLLPGGDPLVFIEIAPSNARRIFTAIDIIAGADAVWDVLTAYETLHHVVPSLVKNEVLYRTPTGARLSQVGGAKVLPGVTFTAKTVLDVVTYMEGVPEHMTAHYVSTATPLKRGLFPRPYSETKLPHRDITMQNVLGEGDFEHYQGI
eukprot:gene10885-22728_t